MMPYLCLLVLFMIDILFAIILQTKNLVYNSVSKIIEEIFFFKYHNQIWLLIINLHGKKMPINLKSKYHCILLKDNKLI